MSILVARLWILRGALVVQRVVSLESMPNSIKISVAFSLWCRCTLIEQRRSDIILESLHFHADYFGAGMQPTLCTAAACP